VGPLEGVKIVELAGIGPGPFCAMLLADMGAEVIRVDRPGDVVEGADLNTPHYDLLRRGRPSLAIDLKNPRGLETLQRLIDSADALVEGFRPGVTERLGIGPEACLERNPRLVYGRMTGWGQEGPIAHSSGHDINYIALVGALEPIGRPGTPPVHPLNLVGDFGGGGMYMAFGIACGLFEAKKSGRGQVIDAAMIDGSALLMTMFYGLKAGGMWKPARASNFLDTGSHFYDSYETADGKYVSVGSIEPKFYAELIEKLGLEGEELPAQQGSARWPSMKDKLAGLFRSKTRDEWCEIMEGSDVCFAPVLTLDEAPEHHHNKHRGTFTEVAGVVQPEAGPRFSRTPGSIAGPPPHPGQNTEEALAAWGFSQGEIGELREAGAIRQA
jgi:alpha-methylacyl-CoA racemase